MSNFQAILDLSRTRFFQTVVSRKAIHTHTLLLRLGKTFPDVFLLEAYCWSTQETSQGQKGFEPNKMRPLLGLQCAGGYAALFISTISIANQPALSAAVDFDGSFYARNISLHANLDIFWTIDAANKTIRVAVHAKAASGWAGVGMSEMGGMEGADILYFETGVSMHAAVCFVYRIGHTLPALVWHIFPTKRSRCILSTYHRKKSTAALNVDWCVCINI